MPYGEQVRLGDARVSFHPAGHVLGSAQVRIEAGGAVWVVSGDYKRAPDPTCAPFEVVPCDVFITEATFGLPIYRWEDPGVGGGADPRLVEREPRGRRWPRCCSATRWARRSASWPSSPRLTDRPALVHGAVEGLVELYRAAGVRMLPTAAR